MKRLLLVAIAVSSGFACAGWAGDDPWAEAKQLAKKAADDLIGDADFVESCIGIPKGIELCNAADAPGNGLVCPMPPRPSEADHQCTLVDETLLETRVGKKAIQLIKMTSNQTVVFKMISAEKSIPAHNHMFDGSDSSCLDQYVRRQEEVVVLFAAYQSGAIDAGVPDSLGEISEFLDALEASNKNTVEFTAGPFFYCNEVDHNTMGNTTTSCCELQVCRCPWDLKGDDDLVDTGDLVVLLGAWGPNADHPADFDGDGVVGDVDLLELIANWGPCPR